MTVVVTGPGGVTPVAAEPEAGGGGFVTRQGKDLRLDGKPFRFAGSNNYYLMYKSPLLQVRSRPFPG